MFKKKNKTKHLSVLCASPCNKKKSVPHKNSVGAAAPASVADYSKRFHHAAPVLVWPSARGKRVKAAVGERGH